MTSYPRMYKVFHPWLALHIFVNFMEKEPFTQFYGCFDLFSQTYEVAKFLIDLIVSPIVIEVSIAIASLIVVDVIHANEHT